MKTAPLSISITISGTPHFLIGDYPDGTILAEEIYQNLTKIDSSRISPKYFSRSDILGAGVTAIVYQGKYDEQTIAFKRFDIKHREYFLKEKNQHLPLEHPNILKLIAFVNEPQCCGLVLELATQNTLFDYFYNNKNVKFDPQISKEIASGIFSGLDFLHSKRIVHRDIKPDNVFIFTGDQNARLIAKIGDFGYSLLLNEGEESRKEDEVTGTITWGAPEGLTRGEDGKFSYSFSYDVYSAGKIGEELVKKTGSSSTKSTELTLLFSRCLSVDQKSRPTANQASALLSRADIKF